MIEKLSLHLVKKMTLVRPFVKIRSIFKDALIHDEDLLKYVFEKSDSISLWIIGLSIGALSIVANNISDIQNSISHECLKPILFLLALSITTGILYRGFYLYFFVIVTTTNKALQVAFSESDTKTIDIEPQLNGNETFEQLLDALMNGFEEDLTYLKATYDTIDETGQKILYKSVVDHYFKQIEYAKYEEELALNFVAEAYNKFTGISKEKFIKKILKPQTGNRYKWTIRITTSLYLIYLLTFICALFAFVYAV